MATGLPSRVPDLPRVLLLWPGRTLSAASNFGVPQLLMLAAAIRRRTDALVSVVDLDCESALGRVDLDRLAAEPYEVIGISCYSSYDYLKVMALAERLRALQPRAWLVAGGYHASARPADFTREGSPFDFVVVGDGEAPLARLVEARVLGRRPLGPTLGPESVPNPSELLPYDWSLLERYRPVARRVATQASIYLSRGCPYDCSFCMERAKRDTSWRALAPEEGVEELHRLDRFLDLSSFTLFIADALFGMKRAWRRAFLEALVRRPVRAKRVWLLIRVDLVEREDIELMARANVSPGFGLESGDPDQLRRIRKSGALAEYLDKMLAVSEWARELDVPFGANVIVGHPGETESTLRTSAAYLRRLFLDSRGTHGFLAVDPFRLYPGSPIDEERERWESETGMNVGRYPWWHDGDQDFLSEWVDPSRELDFRRTLELRRELFDPIVAGIEERFAYQGPARSYFLAAIRSEVRNTDPRARLRTLALYHLWRGLSGGTPRGERRRLLLEDAELAATARAARGRTLTELGTSELGPELSRALEDVPRERFVREEDVAESAEDSALPLVEEGSATISALHAYARAYRVLELAPGDALVELGSGTGYGAALAAELVGAEGRVLAVEIDAELARCARENLAALPQVTVVRANADATEHWRGARKVVCCFAIAALPPSWLEALAEGGVLVAPVGAADDQVLTRYQKHAGSMVETRLASVRYVPRRSELAAPP